MNLLKVLLIAACWLNVEGVASITDSLECRLDRRINVDTFSDYLGEIGNIFGSACGRNRGIFVIEPPDGHTYNCAAFPSKWNVKDANSVKEVDPSVAVPVLDEFVRSVYLSSPQYVRARDPGACDFEAMSELVCGNELPWQRAPWSQKLKAPIRGVNLGGLFVLTRWITPALFTESWVSAGIIDHQSFSKKCASLGVCAKFQEHLDTFYSAPDFVQMKLQGINTVRVPVGYWLFESLTSNGPSGMAVPQQHILEFKHPLTTVISMAMSVGLHVIIDLEPIDPDTLTGTEAASAAEIASRLTLSTAAAIGHFVKHVQETFSLHNVILVEIGSALGSSDGEVIREAVQQVRGFVPDMPVVVLEGSQLPMSQPGSITAMPNVFINTKVYHGYSVQDIASDHPAQDREKLYAHEKIACGFKAPLHFTTCTRAPTLVGEFSLAIDNCMPGVDASFKDYGQCSHLDARANSPWWAAHLHSFGMRQLETYELELGWVFWSYKLDSLAETDPSAPYWSYRLAVQKGLLTPESYGTANTACMHYPAGDYVLGDDTLAPTPYWEPEEGGALPIEGSSNSDSYYNKHRPTYKPVRSPTRRPTTYYIKPVKRVPTAKPSKVSKSGKGPVAPGQVVPGAESGVAPAEPAVQPPPGYTPGEIPGYVPGEPDSAVPEPEQEPEQEPDSDSAQADEGDSGPGEPGYVEPPPPGYIPGEIPGYVPGADTGTGAGAGAGAGGATSPVGLPVGGWEGPPNAADFPPATGAAGALPQQGTNNPIPGRKPTTRSPAPVRSPSSGSSSKKHGGSSAPTFPTGGDFKDDNGDTLAPGNLPPGAIPGEVPGVNPGEMPAETPGEHHRDKIGHSATNGFVLLAVVASTVLATGGFYYWKYYIDPQSYERVSGGDRELTSTGVAPPQPGSGRLRPIHASSSASGYQGGKSTGDV